MNAIRQPPALGVRYGIVLRGEVVDGSLQLGLLLAYHKGLLTA